MRQHLSHQLRALLIQRGDFLHHLSRAAVGDFLAGVLVEDVIAVFEGLFEHAEMEEKRLVPKDFYRHPSTERRDLLRVRSI